MSKKTGQFIYREQYRGSFKLTPSNKTVESNFTKLFNFLGSETAFVVINEKISTDNFNSRYKTTVMDKETEDFPRAILDIVYSFGHVSQVSHDQRRIVFQLKNNKDFIITKFKSKLVRRFFQTFSNVVDEKGYFTLQRW
jgi:hypothetical protein